MEQHTWSQRAFLRQQSFLASPRGWMRTGQGELSSVDVPFAACAEAIEPPACHGCLRLCRRLGGL
jgi:hypothetical protein